MYELIMTIATEAMGTAGMACDSCTEGKFADACRDFKKAAGIMEFLEEEQLPKVSFRWIEIIAAYASLLTIMVFYMHVTVDSQVF